MSKRKIVSICIMVLPLFVVIIWSSVAVIRVKYAHKDLIQFLRQSKKYSPDKREELVIFFEKSRLGHMKSIKPLLKTPWRSDIRLYFYGSSIETHADHHAIKKGPNEWDVKIFK